MLWEYKRKFSKDEKFEKAVQDRFCVEDLKRVSFLSSIKSFNFLPFCVRIPLEKHAMPCILYYCKLIEWKRHMKLF